MLITFRFTSDVNVLGNHAKSHDSNFSDLNWGHLGASLDIYLERCQETTQVLAPQARETWFTVLVPVIFGVLLNESHLSFHSAFQYSEYTDLHLYTVSMLRLQRFGHIVQGVYAVVNYQDMCVSPRFLQFEGQARK